MKNDKPGEKLFSETKERKEKIAELVSDLRLAQKELGIKNVSYTTPENKAGWLNPFHSFFKLFNPRRRQQTVIPGEKEKLMDKGLKWE